MISAYENMKNIVKLMFNYFVISQTNSLNTSYKYNLLSKSA